jgi:RNA polymerase sigma-70 factor (ECF subfamily)
MQAQAVVESVFREEYGKILATLIRKCASFDDAEEAMQDALASAMATWPEQGVPRSPAAWITTTAHRKLIDRARRRRTRRDKEEALRYEIEAASEPDPTGGTQSEDMSVSDDRLRLIFTCCHPALSQEAQVALTLRTLGGLTTGEIAKSFLVPEPTLAQRLVRVKRKICEAGIRYEVPGPAKLAERLRSVQAVLYLIFNEGYVAASGELLVRTDLCNEAIRLGRLLRELLPRDAESTALVALMLLHHSRRDARIRDGKLVTLEEQDRSLWHQNEIDEGSLLAERAVVLGPLGPYQLQAAIAAVHAQAERAADTDWNEIAALYQRLCEVQPSAVVALNSAVAVAMSTGYETGLRQIERLQSELNRYYLFHAARADILRRMGNKRDAASAYRTAIDLASNQVERDFLASRLDSIGIPD